MERSKGGAHRPDQDHPARGRRGPHDRRGCRMGGYPRWLDTVVGTDAVNNALLDGDSIDGTHRWQLPAHGHGLRIELELGVHADVSTSRAALSDGCRPPT